MWLDCYPGLVCASEAVKHPRLETYLFMRNGVRLVGDLLHYGKTNILAVERFSLIPRSCLASLNGVEPL